MRRVPQPPIHAATRPRESRSAVPGLALALAGSLAGFFGLGRITDVETLQGGLALEREIHMAFAHGGVRDTHKTPPTLAALETAANNPALDALASVPASAHSQGRPRFQIDTTAKDPCPT